MSPQEIADRIVPEYRSGSYSCTGVVAKRWNAAYLAAELAHGQKPVKIPQWMKDRHMRCWDPDDPRDNEEFARQEHEVEAFLSQHGLTEEDLHE